MAENTSQVDCRPSDPANLVTQDKINNFFAKPKPKSKSKPKPAPEVDALPAPPPAGGAAEEAKAGGEEGGAAATERSGSIQPVIKEITVPDNRYQVLASPPFSSLAERMAEAFPDTFTYHPTKWDKFPDGTDNIEVGGFTPDNLLRGEHVLFLASFHNNDATLSQFHVMVMLLESFIESLTVVLPFYPTGTMERVDKEGVVATASTLARLFNTLPNCGKPTCLVMYDLHTLQNRFYFNGGTIAQLETTVPTLKEALARREAIMGLPAIDVIAFPDDGAGKRFGKMFNEYSPHVICGKHRVGDKRIVTVMDGSCAGKHVLIVDDMVQTGGTLYECAVVLRQQGALSVSAFCAHGVFPNKSWRRFLRGGGDVPEGDRAVFETFYVTNSIPTTIAELPKDDVFQVIDLMPTIVGSLYSATSNHRRMSSVRSL